MNSSNVNKEIRVGIRPVLKELGFSEFTLRTAWRYSSEKIDVLNFQSFSTYLAEKVGCTTFSFCVRLGCSFKAIPQSFMVKQRDGQLRPAEYQCHFRLPLQKSINQPTLRRADVWYVEPLGGNLGEVIADTKRAIIEVGIPWFDRFQNSNEVLRTLLEESEGKDGFSGFGAENSPIRNFMTGFIALSVGRLELGQERIQTALNSGCLKSFEPNMIAALKRLGRNSSVKS